MKQDTKDTRGLYFVGVNLPAKLHDYLILSALADGVYRSAIIRNVLQKWNDEAAPMQPLISAAAERYKLQWLIAKSKNPKLTIASFKKELRDRLIETHLHPVIIGMILKEIKSNAKNH